MTVALDAAVFFNVPAFGVFPDVDVVGFDFVLGAGVVSGVVVDFTAAGVASFDGKATAVVASLGGDVYAIVKVAGEGVGSAGFENVAT